MTDGEFIKPKDAVVLHLEMGGSLFDIRKIKSILLKCQIPLMH